jgi:protein SCO1
MLNHKLIIAVAAVAAMSAGFWLSSMQQADETSPAELKEKELAEARSNFSPIQGTILSPARKLSIPALSKDNGETFTLDDLSGHWSLLFFGYTNCPDICPVTMGVVAKAKKTATANNHIFPQVVFVSVDPDRDRLEMLSDYVRYFDKDFIGVTGKPALIKALALQMSVVYMKVPAENTAETGSKDDVNANNYTVDHSSALLLLNPEGKLAAFFNPPHDAKTILKDFQTVVNLSN